MFRRILSAPVFDIVSPFFQLDVGVTIDEPDVSLTDAGLALETAIFAALLARRVSHRQRLRGWAVAFFGSAAAAALAGAIDHGFLRRDGSETAHDALWAATLLAIGASSLALVGIGAELGLSRDGARRATAVATVAIAAYAVVVIVVWRDFLVAILAYAPAALFLLGALIRRYVAHREAATMVGIAAVLLAFAAAAVQRLEIGIYDRYLGHNALYHLIQAVSFALLFTAMRRFLG